MIRNEAGVWNKAGVVKGAIIGGIIGTVTALSAIYSLLKFPGYSSILAANPVTSFIGITTAGALIGGGLGGLFRLSKSGEETGEDNTFKMQLREEKLDFAKNRIQTANVKAHKEIIREDKHVVVPITREELVVEKQVLDPLNPDKVVGEAEIIRIALKEEQVKINKNSVILNDVSIYKQKIKDFEHVEETLKKEKLVVENSIKNIDNTN